MAIRINESKRLNALEIISQQDDALDIDNCDFEEYAKTGDQKHLQFKPGKQPTIFLCNFELKGREYEWVKNSMLGGKDEDGSPKVALGSWSQRVVKYTLKDIKNPPDIPENERLVYKSDSGKYANDDTIAKLENLGIVNEIFGMYSNLVLSSHRPHAKN